MMNEIPLDDLHDGASPQETEIRRKEQENEDIR